MHTTTFVKKRLSLYFHLSVAAIAVILSAGCTTVHKDFKPFSPAQEWRGKAPMKVAVVLPETLCSLYYDNNNLTAFMLGPVVCENARTAAKMAFSDLAFFKSEIDVTSAAADFVGIVRPRRVVTYGTKKIPASVITSVALSWELRTADGKRLYGATIYGDGVDQRTFGLADARYQSSMQQCMDDLAENMYREMASAVEKAGKNVETSRRIRAAVESYRLGTTTYAQYRDGKNDEWRLYALHERAKYGLTGYGYLMDPESDRHISLIGDWAFLAGFEGTRSLSYSGKGLWAGIWVTQWGRRMPAIDLLRPSVYLPDSKIDHAKISAVYIRELVGSVYDDHPQCELVFEGNNFETMVMTRRSCQKDYLSVDAYTSRDTYHKHTLTETAQQWLKLRPGMSEKEVIALIGFPPRLISNSMINALTYEYGYGRVVIDKKEGLSRWQLD
jgi:hypothetical protein